MIDEKTIKDRMTVLDEDIQKVNEDFDATENVVGYTLQDTINRNNNFLYWFFSNILGDSNSLPDTMGKKIYEKISNFTANNSDIDTCNVDALVSLANELGVDIKEYNYAYPGSIKRLIDLFSINHSRLFGARDQTGDAFTKNGYANNFNFGRNLDVDKEAFPDTEGVIVPEEWTVKIGTRIVAKELYNNNLILIEPMAIPGATTDPSYSTLHGGLSAYPLVDYNITWGWGLSHPDFNLPDYSNENVFVYYEFYKYKPNTSWDEKLGQIEGIIDWENGLTNIDEDNRSLQTWTATDGTMDSIIDRKLRTGLELFT